MSDHKFPSPETIMEQYPGYPGEYCNQADNECAIRMSIALHKCGIDISESGVYRKTHKHNDIIHQPSAQALADWLASKKRLGRPKEYSHTSGKWQQIDFITKNGLIYFAHSNRGGDGPGHIDVISAGKIGSGFYANKLIWFWEFIDGKYIANL